MIVIGDPAVLSREQTWNEFLHYILDGGGWRGASFKLPSLDLSSLISSGASDGPDSSGAPFHDSAVLDQAGDGHDILLREYE